jgi:hypothetical protein
MYSNARSDEYKTSKIVDNSLDTEQAPAETTRIAGTLNADSARPTLI